MPPPIPPLLDDQDAPGVLLPLAAVPLREHVESLIAELRLDVMKGEGQLREHVMAELGRVGTALEAADQLEAERLSRGRDSVAALSRYFESVLAERADATTLATEEREKAAQALRDGLLRAITEGDARLREHIENQLAQVHAALESADKLEVQRVAAIHAEILGYGDHLRMLAGERDRERTTFATSVEARFANVEQTMKERLDAVRRQLEAASTASSVAVSKAEASTEKRLAAMNEFRATLADQALTLMPREVADAGFVELRAQIVELQKRERENYGIARGASGERQSSGVSLDRWIAIAAVIFTLIVGVIALVIASHNNGALSNAPAMTQTVPATPTTP